MDIEEAECQNRLRLVFGKRWFTTTADDSLACFETTATSPLSVHIAVVTSSSGGTELSLDGQILDKNHDIYKIVRGTESTWHYMYRVVDVVKSSFYECAGIENAAVDNISRQRSRNCSLFIRRPQRGALQTMCISCRTEQRRQRDSESTTSKITHLKETILALKRKLWSLEKSFQDLKESDSRPVAVRCQELLEQELGSKSPSIPSNAIAFLLEQFDVHSISQKTSVRWSRSMIDWALRLHLKSASAYEFIVESGAVRLPTPRTLTTYVSRLPKCVGLSDKVISMFVADYLENCSQPYGKYLALSLDEMKIRANLCYEKQTNKLIGYVDSTDEINAIHSDLSTSQLIASDALVILLRGIATGFERAIAWFPVRKLCAGEIMSIVWETKRRVEFQSIKDGIPRLKIITVTCDGLAANHLFFKLHDATTGVVPYMARDPLDSESFIYFMIDPPHLLKTVRNNMEKSSEKEDSVKYLCNQKPILWDHVEQIYLDDLKNIWRLLPKLTYQHVYLTASYRMKVKPAAQVLSRRMSLAMDSKPEMSSSAELCRYVNRMFDILNGRHPNEARNTRNEDLAPFRSTDDARLKWLEEECLGFFDNWKKVVEAMPLENYEKQRRLLSRQTRTGIEITIRGFTAAVRHILSQPDAPPYILSGVFNQDRLEIYFSHVRSAGGANDHPDWRQFQKIATVLNYTSGSRLREVRGGNISLPDVME